MRGDGVGRAAWGWRFALLVLCGIGRLWPAAAAAAGDTAPAPLHSRGVAAEVGGRAVFLDAVLETWGPVWQDTVAQVRAGKTPPAEGDRRLQAEWDKALQAAVKDELFYHEARRTFDQLLREVIDDVVDANRHSGAGGGRAFIEREVRREFAQNIARETARMEAAALRAGGGMEALAQSLRARGVTYETWRERLQRKAFAGFYFSRRATLALGRPGPGAIREYYRRYPGEFRRPGAVVFRHLFFSRHKRGEAGARQAATDAWQQLSDHPERFAELARALSDDPVSAARGGQDVYDGAPAPEAGRDWLGDVARAAGEEAPGVLGPLLDSPYGWHIAVLLETRPGGPIPFAEVRGAIEARLVAAAEAREMERIYRELSRQVPIRVLSPAFPPEFACARQMDAAPAPPRRHIGGGFPVANGQ